MKVICKSCGKKFDPEKTGHMCPRCGSWYVEKNIDGQFESGAASADSGDYNQDQTSYTEDKNKQYGNVHSEWFKKKEKEEEAAAPAPEPSKEEVLLTEIRDLLKEQK